jgi:hypothetical protein
LINCQNGAEGVMPEMLCDGCDAEFPVGFESVFDDLSHEGN